MHDNLCLLQLLFMSVSTIFLSFVLKKQVTLLISTKSDYGTVRRTVLVLVVLAFVGNFSHIEPGHLIHSVQTLIMSIGWWLLYRIIAAELVRTSKEGSDMKNENQSVKAQLDSVRTYQKSQNEAISELAPEIQTKVNNLTREKDIKKVARRNRV